MAYLIHYADGTSESDEELMHWKYTRKYMKNGKWRYVYDKISGGSSSPNQNHNVLVLVPNSILLDLVLQQLEKRYIDVRKFKGDLLCNI